METPVDDFAKLISAVASLAWPVVLAILLFKLFEPIRSLVESARARKFTIKVAGNELTMDEASEQQRVLLADVQNKVADLEKRLTLGQPQPSPQIVDVRVGAKRVLWVDDKPKNNSFLVASLEERGVRVDTALSTDEGVAKFKKAPYDIVLSDMGRPEGEKAGIDLAKRIKAISPITPIFIYCGNWAASNLRKEALAAGVAEITSSGSTLLGALPLANRV
jgi:CheY-like chemotaxis protein